MNINKRYERVRRMTESWIMNYAIFPLRDVKAVRRILLEMEKIMLRVKLDLIHQFKDDVS